MDMSLATLLLLATVQSAASPIEATLCDVLAEPSTFDGKVVRLRAGVSTDWTHGMYLIDLGCKGAIQVADLDAISPAEKKTFEKAVGTELNRGFRRTAIATFTGRISWRPHTETDDFRYNPFRLSVQKIERVEVSRKWTR
jgi:hypothetical protein